MREQILLSIDDGKRAANTAALRCILAVLLLSIPAFAYAQTASPAPANATPTLTLASALTQAQVPAGEIVMAVGAEKTNLPEGATSPPAHPTAMSLVQTFALATRTFGTVRALAPPTMTLINTAPTNPDTYADIPSAEAGELLAATLTDVQWQHLTSAQGLGTEDLTSDEQRVLFRAILPQGKATVTPIPSFSDLDSKPTPQDITNELPNVHLRLGQTTQIYLPVQGQLNMTAIFLPIPHLVGAPTRYQLSGNNTPPQSMRDGVAVRAETPNTPKKSELNENAPAWQTLIPIEDLKTVGDLIARISTSTHAEIYADPRYAGKSLTFAPFPAGTQARAIDLLHTLAYCLTATYRKVGPAYVLTDDVIGVGTRRKVWAEFDKDVDALRQKAVADAGDHMAHAHSLAALDTFGDQLALSPEEKADGAKHDDAPPELYGATLPLSQLTPVQQETAQKMADQLATPSSKDEDSGMRADLSRNISVFAQPQIELLVPSLDGPIDLTLDLTAMFKPAQTAVPASEPPASKASLHGLLTALPRSAVFAAPQTAEDLKALIQSMQVLGFNQLWLSVPAQEGKADLTLLDEALHDTRNTKISVYPVVDLLDWGSQTFPTLADLTILGQTSAQAEQHHTQRTAVKKAATSDKPSSSVVVSLFAPTVQTMLTALVHTLAARPGVAGIVWRGTAPSGYDLPKQALPWIDTADPLGYSLPARLAFLRHSHADPVDISDTENGGADIHLPLFDDAGLDTKLLTQWREFRADSDVDFLRVLSGVAGKTPIFIEQRRPQNTPIWVGSWDGPRMPLPANHQAWEDTEQGGTPPPALSTVNQAKSQSYVALIVMQPSTTLTQKALAAQISKLVSGTRWDGIVLDLTPAPGLPKLPGNPLKALDAQ